MTGLPVVLPCFPLSGMTTDGDPTDSLWVLPIWRLGRSGSWGLRALLPHHTSRRRCLRPICRHCPQLHRLHHARHQRLLVHQNHRACRQDRRSCRHLRRRNNRLPIRARRLLRQRLPLRPHPQRPHRLRQSHPLRCHSCQTAPFGFKSSFPTTCQETACPWRPLNITFDSTCTPLWTWIPTASKWLVIILLSMNTIGRWAFSSTMARSHLTYSPPMKVNPLCRHMSMSSHGVSRMSIGGPQ